MLLEKWYHFMSTIEPTFENIFEYITRRVVRYPWKTLGSVFMFVILCLGGFMNFHVSI